MYLHFTPLTIQWMFPRFTWRREVGGQKKIFLTFDDGPVPEVTPFVLDVLRQYNAKATFFCVGENVLKHPNIFRQVLEEGHQAGNHTQNHLNGFKTDPQEYLDNVKLCEQQLLRETSAVPGFFRPPYGRIRKKAADGILSSYEIIMWDVLPADFDNTITPEKCLQKSIRYTRSGSIVVFHDNPKAFKNLSLVLPLYLAHFSALGYTFELL